MGGDLETLAAKSAIADLVHTYARNIRDRLPERNAGLFTADASFEVREVHPLDQTSLKVRSRADGHAAVMASITGSTAANRVFPAIHNLIVRVDGDSAEASSLMIATVYPGGGEMLGEYEDRFRCEDGIWRFLSRCYTIFRET